MRRLALVGAVLAACAAAGGALAQGKPDTEPAYIDGQTVTIAAMHFVTAPSPAHLEHADDVFIAAYPVDATATGGSPVTFASGYRPNCDPCFHPGLPTAFVYHDHVLSGAPTAGDASAARHLIIVLYRSDVTTDPGFRPVTSVAELKAGEAAGRFQPIGSGANPYELDTGLLAVTPALSPNA